MNVLLTGGAGYIGSHLAIALTDAGHNVVILDNFSNSNKQALDCIFRITGKNIPCIEGDVCDQMLVLKVLTDYKVCSVIHLAGLKAVGESSQQPLEYFANNIQGSISLLKAMITANVKRLVFSSSATVYGDPQYLPIDEAHPLSVTNPYARTKLHIEEMLKDISNSDPEWKIICLRYFNPVGAHESGLIGENPKGIPNNLMPYLSKVAAGSLPHLNVFGGDYSTKDGTGVRDYIHIMDIAEGHIAALILLQKTSGWDAINLGTGCGYSVLELIKKFESASGQKVDFKVVGRRPGDIASCYAGIKYALSKMEWRPKRDLDDMCQSAWKWERYGKKF
jgi:UDP-glucose 4-epimerase